MIEAQLKQMGIINVRIKRNLASPILYEEIVKNQEGFVAHLGPVVVRSGKYTGRSPQNRFIVEQKPSEDFIWWSDENKPFERDKYEILYDRVVAYLQNRKLYVMDGYAIADPKYRMPVRVISRWAWHSLFARNMFLRELDEQKLSRFEPEIKLIVVPEFNASPNIDGTTSEAFVILNMEKKEVLIGGTGYAGEIKKAVFSMVNYFLPQKGVLTLHSSANMGKEGDVALFFGLSGTGKTTLSSDPDRLLIGDDEHGWSDNGVFNIEGGCYAKVIRLSKEDEPLIYETTRKFGTILENVVIDPISRRIDLNDNSITENTRASYPITHIPNIVEGSFASHPKNIIMLTYDAFGVLPPVSELDPSQAMYHFLSGYTAKVAGTEEGVKSPKATFSCCFGSPFMTQKPNVYAKLLGEKIKKHNVKCWLVNTGYIKGGYGEGERISIEYTRAIINAILQGRLDRIERDVLPVFGLRYPRYCPNVPNDILSPQKQWKDKDAYLKQLKKLAIAFVENFKKFEKYVDDDVKKAQPVF